METSWDIREYREYNGWQLSKSPIYVKLQNVHSMMGEKQPDTSFDDICWACQTDDKDGYKRATMSKYTLELLWYPIFEVLGGPWWKFMPSAKTKN